MTETHDHTADAGLPLWALTGRFTHTHTHIQGHCSFARRYTTLLAHTRIAGNSSRPVTSIPLPNCRPSVPDRCFVSALAEARLVECLASIRDRSLQTLFSNCWLNTLDTTIFDHFADNGQADLARAQPRTWVVTGDIAAMWLRDSTNQVTPYLSLLAPPPGTNPANYTPDQKEWEALYRLMLGVVYAQASCILLHPRATEPPLGSETQSADPRSPNPPLPSIVDVALVSIRRLGRLQIGSIRSPASIFVSHTLFQHCHRPHPSRSSNNVCVIVVIVIVVVVGYQVTGWQVAGDGRIRTAQQLRERMVGCNTPTAWV
ncbi:BQ5605_C002g01226 [Microbotryum silenes-dioicae]|uniref:BQ5605_C002g01226 protein n=1 Tax=Microbotryum silenes-dioicae TaxID=796604 RepID=A0A2X0LY31_9BASI|nr:BQ5605_C002g01226 [Microbotryum silenes-dioicae]